MTWANQRHMEMTFAAVVQTQMIAIQAARVHQKHLEKGPVHPVEME
jgi:hypothetical protein